MKHIICQKYSHLKLKKQEKLEKILNGNYTKKWGESDIVAEKASKLYFIEVKSVACDLPTGKAGTLNDVNSFGYTQDVPRETSDYRPEENMHPWKLKRLSRTIQTYLLSENVLEEKEWQVDLLVVFLDIKNKKAKIKVVSDIIL